MSTKFELNSYLKSLSNELQDLASRKVLAPDAFTDGQWNNQSRMHALVIGALVPTVQRPLVPMVEVKLSRGFCPDLCVMDETETFQAGGDPRTNLVWVNLVGTRLRIIKRNGVKTK